MRTLAEAREARRRFDKYHYDYEMRLIFLTGAVQRAKEPRIGLAVSNSFIPVRGECPRCARQVGSVPVAKAGDADFQAAAPAGAAAT